MSTAITAAEMGILVMATLHTNGAAPTVDRMVNAFPADKQAHVRTMLSTSLRGVISQQLLQRADGQGRVAALEILINTPASANLIRQGKLDQLETAMQSGGALGMRTMDMAIQQLLDQGVISGAEAYKKGHQQGQVRAVAEQDRRAVTPPPHPGHACALPYANGPTAPRAHDRGRADRHLGALPAPARPRLPVRLRRRHPRHADHDPGAAAGHDAGAADRRDRQPSTSATTAAFCIGFDHFHTTHSRGEPAPHACACTSAARRAATSRAARVRQAYDEQARHVPARPLRARHLPASASTPDQYGDSCEVCGATYTPADLIDPVSTLSGSAPVWRESEHLFFRLGDFEAMLREWLGAGEQQRRGARQARRVVRGRAAGLGHLARCALLRLRDARRARQVSSTSGSTRRSATSPASRRCARNAARFR